MHYYYESNVNQWERADRFLLTAIEVDSRFRYWGVRGGLSAAFGPGGESVFKALFPTIGLRLGWMEHLYLSAELFDFQLLRFYNPSLNLHLLKGRLWLQLGSGTNFDHLFPFARIQYRGQKGLIFHAQIHFDSYANKSAWMFGLGKRFRR